MDLFDDEQNWQEFYAIVNSWIGTPYRHMAKVKNRGCDCGTFILACLEEAGIVDGYKYSYYSRDWHMHGSINILERSINEIAKKVNSPYSLEIYHEKEMKRGDWLLFRMSPKFANHGGIYIGNNKIVHSINDIGVVEEEIHRDYKKAYSHSYRLKVAQ